MTEKEKLERIIRCFFRKKGKGAKDQGAHAPLADACGCKNTDVRVIQETGRAAQSE
ncbi:MAG: hypothetical protein IKO55_06120 [Kiritimatiellae bacterium]|nr:hypothetical protein [Kiritimatiellia bacterium]